ncbi:MAG: 30S ribosomal protein S6 [Patescibacteria group bacterium]
MEDKMLKEDRMEVYEIGYILVSSIPPEKVSAEAEALKGVLSKKDAVMIAEEAPEIRTLAYEMTKKVGASNQHFDQGYFGWFKFEMPAKSIESVKKAFEENASMLRMLLITTVKEATYLGKKAPAVILEGEAAVVAPEVAATAPASAEEIDKSIDAMVKEA